MYIYAKHIMSIENQIYKVTKIEIYQPKVNEVVMVQNLNFQNCIKLVLDKKVETFGPYVNIYTKDGCMIDHEWKFIDNIYLYCPGTFYEFSKLKEKDYIYITSYCYNSKMLQEMWWKFLGSLKDPSIELIELCTSMINQI